jgi:osmotically inducible protein OsmC
MITRTATAVWRGGLKEGTGVLATESGLLQDVPYSYARRFEGEPGTNPEELIAAAHAGCFAMALSLQLEQVGARADSIEVRAAITLEKTEAGFAVTRSHLDVTAVIPRGDGAVFVKAAEQAKAGCPISKLLNARISMNARLVT